jgi:hypothetical protein
MYKFAHELTKDMIENMTVQTTQPWFIFQKEFMLTKDARGDLREIDTQLTFLQNIREETELLYNSFLEKYKAIKAEYENYSPKDLNPQEKIENEQRIQKVIAKLESAFEVISYMKIITANEESELIATQDLLKDRGFIDELLRVGVETSRDEKFDPPTVVWKFSRERKYESFSDVINRQAEMKQNEEELVAEKNKV